MKTLLKVLKAMWFQLMCILFFMILSNIAGKVADQGHIALTFFFSIGSLAILLMLIASVIDEHLWRLIRAIEKQNFEGDVNNHSTSKAVVDQEVLP